MSDQTTGDPLVNLGLTPTTAAPTSQSTVLGIAQKYLGVPYVWGGASPKGFDCSGFVMYVFSQLGVNIPHFSGAQYSSPLGQQIPLGPANNLLMNAQPGDVVFFGMNNSNPANQHEGIIVSTAGQGTMINAPYKGANVSLTPIGTQSSADEPISGIRRFSNNGGGAGNTFAASAAATSSVYSGSPSLTSFVNPLSPNENSQSGLGGSNLYREALGVLLMIAGAVVAGVGLTVLAKNQVPSSLMAIAAVIPK